MNITHRKEPNYTLNIGQTDSFKTIKVQVVFLNDLDEKTVTNRSLVPYLLKAVTTNYPTRKDFATHLEDMYAAGFSAGVKKIGLAHEIVFDVTMIDSPYALEGEDMLEEAFALLSEVLLNPLFDTDIFDDEKRLMEEYFLGIYANKMRYTITQLQQTMYNGEPYAVQAMGIEEDVKKLTLEKCISAYRNMLKDDKIHINVVGDVNEDRVKELIRTYLPFSDRDKQIIALDKTDKPEREANHTEIVQDVQQAKLAIGYQFPVFYDSDEYYSAVVFNTLLGGGMESLLFKRIREELNKVYFIGSMYDQYKGSIMIYGGIDAKEYPTVQTEIESILAKIEEQEYSDTSLDIAKRTLINSLIESFDSSGAMASRINHLAIFDKTFDYKKLIQKVERVSKSDISALVKKVSQDVSVLLRGDSNE